MRSADDLGDSLGDLAAALRDFARARNWERFHRPKNLAMGLAGEASELAVRRGRVCADDVVEALRPGPIAEAAEFGRSSLLICRVNLAEAGTGEPGGAFGHDNVDAVR